MNSSDPQDSEPGAFNAISSVKAQTSNVVDLTSESDDDRVFAKSKEIIISETDDEEDEDLKSAIALSLQDVNMCPPIDFQIEQDASMSPPRTENSSGVPLESFGILGLDRKKEEQERLARLAKRKAEDDISGRRLLGSSSKPPLSQPNKSDYAKRAKGARSSMRTDTTPSTTPGIQFPRGTVKKTWAFLFPRKGDDIKIEEILQSSNLEFALLSSFQWSMEWLFSKLNTSKTRLLLVMQAKDESTKREYEADIATISNLRLCFPPMDGPVNCMHSKLMLLFHPDYLRIVVPSANLVPYDWGEVGVMENSVFLIDLPLLEDNDIQMTKTSFYEELVYFLKASTVHENIVAKLSGFDFSKTTRFAFVHTIGGSHSTGELWRRTGHCGLGRAVSTLGLRTFDPVEIDFTTSSLGTLTNEFLRSIYLAAQGDNGLTEFALRTAKTFPAKNWSDPNILIPKDAGKEWEKRFRVYFPSENTVKESIGGPQSAGTICFMSKWYEDARFQRHVLRECVSRRKGLLMHNKMLFTRPQKPIQLPDGSICQAWYYIGSANLSESAWGRLVQDRSTKAPKLNCRNWECGVLVPIVKPLDKENGGENVSFSTLPAPIINEMPRKSREAVADDQIREDTDIALIFGDAVPIPMQVPSRSYGPDLKPWYYMED